MASRSGNTGAIIFAVFTGILWLVFFVLTLAFYGKINTLKADAETAQTELARFVNAGERDRADRLVQVAGNKSVFSYLDGSLKDAWTSVLGTQSTTPEQFNQRLAEATGGMPAIERIRQLERQVDELQRQLADANTAREAAVQGLAQQSEFLAQQREDLLTTEQRVKSDVDSYSSRVTEHVQKLTDEIQAARSRIDQARAQFEQDKVQLQDRINDLVEQNLVLEGQIQNLRNERRGELLKPKSEFALVDGRIISVDGAGGTITIDRGRRNKVILGMNFAIYSDASAIRPDASGSYPPGKAMVEVINIQDNAATCRVLRSSQGNPIVRGDVIANPIYDPNKVYTFLVYGHFDADGDGISSAFEADAIRALIKEWGGTVVDDLTGDVDFLVLGARPLLPPRPSSGAQIELLQDWIRLNGIVERYNELQSKAEATSIPILNQNRLNTLILGR